MKSHFDTLFFQEISPLETVDPEEVQDNDKPCDVVSSYSSLKLTLHFQTIEYLNKALDILTQHVSSDCAGMLLEAKAYDVVKNIAYEYRLQSWSLKSVQAWLLCLKIAKLADNKLWILESLGFILEFSDLKSKMAKELLEEADELAELLEKLDSNEAYETLALFHANQGFAFLKNQGAQEGYTEYNKADSYFKKIDTKGNFLIKIKIDYLLAHYLLLPCNENIKDHNAFPLMALKEVFYSISGYFKVEGNKHTFLSDVESFDW